MAADWAGVLTLLGMLLLRSGPGSGVPTVCAVPDEVARISRKASNAIRDGYSASSARQLQQLLPQKTIVEVSVPRTASVPRVRRSMAAVGAGVVMSLGMALLRSGPRSGVP